MRLTLRAHAVAAGIGLTGSVIAVSPDGRTDVARSLVTDGTPL